MANRIAIKGACLEFFDAIGRFQPTFSETHQAWKIISNVRSLKSRIKTCSFLEAIITLGNEVFKDFLSNMVVDIGTLGFPARETTK